MPPNILAIGISSCPLRIYISTKEGVLVFKVEPNANRTCLLQGTPNIEKIRFQQGLVIFCSKTSVIGFRFQDDRIWKPKFVIEGDTIHDSLLVHETKLLVLGVKEKVLGWQIYDYEELNYDELNNDPVKFQPRYQWSAAEDDVPFADVLDTSSEGLCLLSSNESDIYVIDLMKEGDNPASGRAGGECGDSCRGGYGCFLRSCGIDGHQAPFIFCEAKYLEWTISQKHQNNPINLTTEDRVHLMEQYKTISIWQSNEFDRNDDDPVFPFCYHYSLGVAFAWNSKKSSFFGATVSAVILLDYAEKEGNCRLYEGSDYTDGHYSPMEDEYCGYEVELGS
jgi:hypothetical protein